MSVIQFVVFFMFFQNHPSQSIFLDWDSCLIRNDPMSMRRWWWRWKRLRRRSWRDRNEREEWNKRMRKRVKEWNEKDRRRKEQTSWGLFDWSWLGDPFLQFFILFLKISDGFVFLFDCLFELLTLFTGGWRWWWWGERRTRTRRERKKKIRFSSHISKQGTSI